MDDLIAEDAVRPSRMKSSRTRVGSGSRSQPYDANGRSRRNDAKDENIEFADVSNSIKVGGTTEVRELASMITQSFHDPEIPCLLTIGNNSINQAVKGIAVARSEITGHDSQDLMFQPAFRHPDKTRPLIAFYLIRQRPAREDSRTEEVTLTVSGGGKIHALAGAIAGKVRDGKRVSTIAIGVDAVTNAVLAVGNARLYLEEDNMDIKVMPEFVKVEKNGTTYNALKFRIQPEHI